MLLYLSPLTLEKNGQETCICDLIRHYNIRNIRLWPLSDVTISAAITWAVMATTTVINATSTATTTTSKANRTAAAYAPCIFRLPALVTLLVRAINVDHLIVVVWRHFCWCNIKPFSLVFSTVVFKAEVLREGVENRINKILIEYFILRSMTNGLIIGTTRVSRVNSLIDTVERGGKEEEETKKTLWILKLTWVL